MADIATVLTDSSNCWFSGTKVFFPGDDGFADVTSRWAIHKPPTYAAAISPAIEEDVVKAVSLSKQILLLKNPLILTSSRCSSLARYNN